MPDIKPVPAVFTRASDPACVRAKDWTFKEKDDEGNTGLTSLSDREMFVPMDDSPEALGVRQHEMLHVAMSPIPTGGMDAATLAAEDGRIETLATDKGLHREAVMPDADTSMTLTRAVHKGMFAVAALAVACVGSPQEAQARTVLTELGLSAVTDLMDAARDAYRADPSFGSTVKVAAMLRELLPEDEQGQGQGQDGKGQGEGQGKPTGKPTAKSTGKPTGKPVKPVSPLAHGYRPATPKPEPYEDERCDQSATEQENREDGIKSFDMDEYADKTRDEMFGTGDRLNWSQPYLETPPRTVRLVETRGKGKGKASDTGTVPKRLSRMTIDQKVFSSSRHKKKGTVLLDLSGSTSWVHRCVEDIIRKIPAAVVAGYWGCNGTGILRVLAANGKMVARDLLYPTGDGNEIDGPAIAWLAAQQGPRVWVFDGGATGKDDSGRLTDEMRKELEYYKHVGRIQVIDPNEPVIQKFTSGAWNGDYDAIRSELTDQISQALR